MSGGDQFGQIAGRGVEGDTAHRYPMFIILVAPGGQGDAEHLRCRDRVVEEHFIEIAHPVKQNGILELALDLEILLQHRRHFDYGRHAGSCRS